MVSWNGKSLDLLRPLELVVESLGQVSGVFLIVAIVPFGPWQTPTFIGGLSLHGLGAPMVMDGAMNGDLFVAYVQQVFLSTLSGGQIIVMDNLSSHKRREVRPLIESVGCEWGYLPPYRPDLNPIEMAFSKLKALMRARQEQTAGALWEFLGKVMDAFESTECAEYFQQAGYPANETLQ